MRAWLGNVRAEGRSVGLVPTMGAFHAGHHSLMRTAREEQDSVVVSLFVNPAQFNDSHDLAAYPRTEANDAAEAAELGVDVLFAPPVSEIYPDGFATTVQVARAQPRSSRAPSAAPGTSPASAPSSTSCSTSSGPTSPTSARRTRSRSRSSSGWCATSTCRCGSRSCRPCASPTASRCPSRNVRLSPEDRARALGLSRALNAAAAVVAAGERDADAIRAAALAEIGDVDAEYLAIVDPLTFAPLRTVSARTLVAIAAQVGPVRLIDNVVLEPVPVATG